MPRIRYLKPDFFKDEDLAEKEPWIRLLYAGLWTIADRQGRLEDRARRIKADIFPYDDFDIESGLTELAKHKNSGRPFIQRYEINNEGYIQILMWEKHQRPHHTEKASEIPPITPDGDGDGEGNGDGDGKLARSKLEKSNREISVKDTIIGELPIFPIAEQNTTNMAYEETVRMSKKGRKTWLTPCADVWLEIQKGEMPYGKWIKSLHELILKHGSDDVVAHFRIYLKALDKPIFASPTMFTSTYGQWAKENSHRDVI